MSKAGEVYGAPHLSPQFMKSSRHNSCSRIILVQRNVAVFKPQSFCEKLKKGGPVTRGACKKQTPKRRDWEVGDQQRLGHPHDMNEQQLSLRCVRVRRLPENVASFEWPSPRSTHGAMCPKRVIDWGTHLNLGLLRGVAQYGQKRHGHGRPCWAPDPFFATWLTILS